MANNKSANVWIIDTTGALSDGLIVSKVKLVAGSANASFSIKKGGSSGTVVYSDATTASTEKMELVNIRLPAGCSPYVTISGSGAVAYVYLK